MRAMVLCRPKTPLVLEERPDPNPGLGKIRVRVSACGVCRTDLHLVDGDLPPHRAAIVPGHEVVGRVDALGGGADPALLGARVGVPWLGHACGHCPYCESGAENLCDAPAFTGWDRDGGFATHVIADAAFAVSLDGLDLDDVTAAPLMCAGLIGWRSLVRAGDGRALGLYGFGAAAHILAQIAVHQERRVYAFTRPGDVEAQAFARSVGCLWAGGSDAVPPEPLDAAIIFAPVGDLVPQALKVVRKGGRVVCGGIHMSDIPAFPYSLLWQEREVVSVANLTRTDARDFLRAASEARPRIEVRVYPLEDANRALDDLRAGRLSGAAVLVP